MRWFSRAASALLCCFLVTLFTPTAFAATQTEPYSVFRCVRLPGVSTYAQVTATGTLSFTVGYSRLTPGPFYSNIKISSPTLDVSSRTSCARTAGFVTRSKATISQGFYADSCSANANLGISVPWGISVSPTFSCGSTRVGTRTTTYGSNDLWIQNNSGAPVFWSGSIHSGSDNPPWPCLHMKLSVTLYQGTGSSDTAIWGDNERVDLLTC
jgi:hypothetical protein